MNMNIVIIGLSVTSSWGNGHATTYRALIGALARRGHRVTFLERDAPWYAQHEVARLCNNRLTLERSSMSKVIMPIGFGWGAPT